jgi:hypothetical protein
LIDAPKKNIIKTLYKMTDKDIIKCSKAVLNFIEEGDNQGVIPTPMQSIMNEVLSKNGWRLDRLNGDMIEFTKYLNKKYNLGYDLEEWRNLRKFFTNNSIPFYKKVINQLTREEKIEKILN